MEAKTSRERYYVHRLRSRNSHAPYSYAWKFSWYICHYFGTSHCFVNIIDMPADIFDCAIWFEGKGDILKRKRQN